MDKQQGGGSVATVALLLEPGTISQKGEAVSTKKRRKLSAKEKWNIYKECIEPGAVIAEVLRKHGLYSTDLQRIRKAVEAGALEALGKSGIGRKKVTSVPKEEYDDVKTELAEKEKALAEMSVLFTSLKKKVNLE